MNATLELPYPSLCEGRFASITAHTDEQLFETCGIRLAFTERTGGYSEGGFESLNTGYHVDDEKECVTRNRETIVKALGNHETICLSPRQVHGDEVYVVDKPKEQLGGMQRILDEGIDALIVEHAHVAALLSFADCVPVVIVSPSGRFASVHAGWRGVVNGIALKALYQLKKRDQNTGMKFDSSAYNVYIGPYIHAECFETGEEVAATFLEYFGKECIVRNLIEGVEKFYIDLGVALRKAFTAAGIDKKRLCDVGLCTVCNNERFFSYRAQEGICGRHSSFVVRMR